MAFMPRQLSNSASQIFAMTVLSPFSPFFFFKTSSWQIPKFLPHKKEEVEEDAEIGQDKKNCSSPDGKVPVLEVEKTADSKVEGEEEIYPHLTVTWDPPRRLVNSVDDASSLIFLQIFYAFFSSH